MSKRRKHKLVKTQQNGCKPDVKTHSQGSLPMVIGQTSWSNAAYKVLQSSAVGSGLYGIISSDSRDGIEDAHHIFR